MKEKHIVIKGETIEKLNKARSLIQSENPKETITYEKTIDHVLNYILRGSKNGIRRQERSINKQETSS